MRSQNRLRACPICAATLPRSVSLANRRTLVESVCRQRTSLSPASTVAQARRSAHRTEHNYSILIRFSASGLSSGISSWVLRPPVALSIFSCQGSNVLRLSFVFYGHSSFQDCLCAQCACLYAQGLWCTYLCVHCTHRSTELVVDCKIRNHYVINDTFIDVLTKRSVVNAAFNIAFNATFDAVGNPMLHPMSHSIPHIMTGSP